MVKKVSEFPIPQTFVFENNLLAQLVANPADIEMARRQVTEEIFSDEKARSVWRTIVEMSDAGQEISLETVYPRVDSSHFQTYILPKMGEYRGAMGTVKCLDALLNASAKRVAYFKALDLLTTATGEGSIEDLKRPAEDFLNTLAGYEQPDRDTIDQQDAFNSLGAVLEQNAKDKAAGKRLRVPTSFRTLDWLTYGGFANGNLVVLAARPSVGKTAIALQMARTAAAAGVPALYFSMEMTALELSQRMLFSTRLLDPVDVANGVINWELYETAVARFKDYPILYNDSSFTLDEICQRIRKYARQGKCGIAFIDYLGLITFHDNRTIYQQVTEASRRMKLLAKSCGIPVVLLCQLNRDSAKDEKEPQLYHLRDSGSIEQDADIVLMLERDKNKEDGINIYVRKNRQGRCETFQVVHDEYYANFYEPEKDQF